MRVTTVPVKDLVASVDGLRLHYREWGDDPFAEPLLVLHGITGHAWEFDRMAAALADRYRVLALNQRGHGASSWAQGTTSTSISSTYWSKRFAPSWPGSERQALSELAHRTGGMTLCL